MASLRVESTGKMFFSTSSMGPGRWAIFSFKLSANLALFSFIWVACSDGSAPVSEDTQSIHTSYGITYMLRLNRCTEWDLNNTLQDVHPDQLCPLWTTANLVLEKILCLQRNTNRGLSDKHFPFPRFRRLFLN